MSTTRQQLKAAEKLASKFPLFVDQLVPELPVLKAHVEANGNRDMIGEPPLYQLGQGVRVRGASYTLHEAVGTVYKIVPGWTYEGHWRGYNYYVCYAPNQNVALFTQQLPAWPLSAISLFIP